jgi:GNAT superfamily N-acetyltransferase
MLSHNTSVTTIRPAQASDTPLLFEMLRASATDQGSPESLAVTEADLLDDGFGPDPRFHCLIAEHDGAPAGLALYFFNYSTWVSRKGLYLEDIYVDPRFRRAGVARALMQRLKAIAKDEGCRRMQWLVLRENTSAVQLYRSIGARSFDDWMLMAIHDEASQ